ncbi:MAG TPA: YbaK/EbsC family protein [Pirellulaceae bacterium]|nr:YbaK/EbsC family protein [Pirellulaceae bacterium]
MNVKTYLEQHQVPFGVHQHRRTGDASHLAQAVHVPGKHVAKTVLLHVNHSYGDAVAVLPATSHVDFDRLSAMLGGAEVRLATEQDVALRCPDCEAGVLPPFGSLYGMRTLVDESLADDEIYFEGNSHDEAISISFADFRRLESPLMGHFAAPGVK